MPALRSRNRRSPSNDSRSSDGSSSSSRHAPYSKASTTASRPRAARMTATKRPLTPAPQPEKRTRTTAGYSGLRGDLKEQGRVPTEQELARMKSVDSIDWKTPGTDEVTTYHVGDNVVVVPASKAIGKRTRHELTEVELWRGQIVEIRIPHPGSVGGKERRSKDAWAVLAWYYSPLTYKTMGAPGDLKGYRKRDFGTYELIYTPSHTDPVHLDTLNGTEEVFNYDEADYDQDDIPVDSFYTRSEFDTDKKTWVEGPPSRECICKETFKLYEDEEMYYCPRPGCHIWYHQSCLEEKNFRVRDLKLTKFADEWETSFDEDYLDTIKEEVQNLPRGDTTKVCDRLASYARRPIIKGGKYGTTGNIATTLRARWLIHKARRGVKLPVDWKEYCKYKRQASASSTSKKTERIRRSTMLHYEPETQGPMVYSYFCPKCKKAI